MNSWLLDLSLVFVFVLLILFYCIFIWIWAAYSCASFCFFWKLQFKSWRNFRFTFTTRQSEKLWNILCVCACMCVGVHPQIVLISDFSESFFSSRYYKNAIYTFCRVYRIEIDFCLGHIIRRPHVRSPNRDYIATSFFVFHRVFCCWGWWNMCDIEVTKPNNKIFRFALVIIMETLAKINIRCNTLSKD